MATLRNKRKLAAVLRETPEGTRNSQWQNTLDPELAQEYISQVSEEIERRVTKKRWNQFSWTVSRILGALSKLDEFLLNPQVRTCSVAFPGTSRNSDSENREPTGDRSLNDPCPEAMFSSHHSGNLNGSELEEFHHMVTGVQEEIPYCSHHIRVCWLSEFSMFSKSLAACMHAFCVFYPNVLLGFHEKLRYFSKIAHIASNNAAIILRFVNAPLS